MKKRLKKAKNLSIGDTIKITGYTWEIDGVFIDTVENHVEVSLWLWARPSKRCVLRFSDPSFPVTVR